VDKRVNVRRSPVSSSTHLRASHLSVPATLCAGGSCSTKCGTVYFLCAIYTKRIKATQNWLVAGCSCVSHRSCSVDLDETWNGRYTWIPPPPWWNPIATINGSLLRPGSLLVRSIRIGDISKNDRCIIKCEFLKIWSFIWVSFVLTWGQ